MALRKLKMSSTSMDCSTYCGCHIAGLFCSKGMWLMAIVSIVVVSLFEMLWHGTVMMADYANSSVLWRPFGEMNMNLIYLANILTGLVYAMLFKLCYRGSGVVEGVKDGVLIALPLTICTLTVYATQPIPLRIVELWAAGRALEGALVGLVLSLACCFCCKK